MLRQVAETLARVHRLGILHRDIAARNILCDGEGNVKLADFGLAKCAHSIADDDAMICDYQTTLTPGHHYAIAWCAPESLDRECSIYSIKSAIYSFGVLLWQCCAHCDPFDNVANEVKQEETAGLIESKIFNAERPDLSKLDRDTPEELAELMEICWETDPEKRPDLDIIIQTLKKVERRRPR